MTAAPTVTRSCGIVTVGASSWPMRVYHFVSRHWGLDDLARRRLKISKLNDLNDPFELLGYSSRDPLVRAALNRTKDEMTATTGLLCFSRSWRNPVQWGHYADKHRGLCLGFDVPDALLTAVSYRRRRLQPNLTAIQGDPAAAERHMRQMLATKFSHWRYENEVRCFVALDQENSEDELHFMPFSEQLALREVIIGHCADITRAELAAALGDSCGSVTQRKARLAFRSFRIVEQRQASLWP